MRRISVRVCRRLPTRTRVDRCRFSGTPRMGIRRRALDGGEGKRLDMIRINEKGEEA